MLPQDPLHGAAVLVVRSGMYEFVLNLYGKSHYAKDPSTFQGYDWPFNIDLRTSGLRTSYKASNVHATSVPGNTTPSISGYV